MKLNQLKTFQKKAGQTLDDVMDYLAGDLAGGLRDLMTGLKRLSLDENFDSFTAELTIAPSSEIVVRNQLRTAVPSQWILTRKNQYGCYVAEGTQGWDQNYVYLKNYHASGTAVVTAKFFR